MTILTELEQSKRIFGRKRNKIGGLQRWIMANPEVKLPRSTSEIADITGLTRDQVKTWLYRRRKEAKIMMEAILRIGKNVPLMMLDSEGHSCTIAGAKRATFQYDHWSATCVLVIWDDKGLRRTVEVPNLRKLFESYIREAQKVL